ncbi:C40 family peptidase [Sphingobacterium hungaricum]|uniref:Glycoside hydrolase n=1 Tax=Sphingobacterium hungaricum TaxID=2082723 RepID=A0A928UXN4_9SPHI|nr:C40 family peptidase [Sphingobacterium hungaricum]MBE8714908.1 glycoside hydrolase [Sphingobacterium hungaricum]
MNLAICTLSLIPLRADKSHRSEMVSQLLFGELFDVLKQEKEWSYIKILENGYEGWLQNGQFESISANNSNKKVKIVGINQARAVENQNSINLIHGSPIELTGTDSVLINEKSYKLDGELRTPSQDDFAIEFPNLIAHYLNAPYLWGGRSAYGIDCSGLSQLVYRHFGIVIPRDAWQQAEGGIVVDFVSEAKAGDLAFFDNEEGRITHVGIMIDSETIFHASAKVRIDKFDSEGIYNQDYKHYSHKFRIMKRYF